MATLSDVGLARLDAVGMTKLHLRWDESVRH